MKHILLSRALGTKFNIRENNSTRCFGLECFDVSGNVSAMYRLKCPWVQAFVPYRNIETFIPIKTKYRDIREVKARHAYA